MVSADEHEDDHKKDDGPMDDEEMADEPPEAAPDEFENDIEILNFALTLEYLEAEFYTQGLQNIDAAALQQQFEGWVRFRTGSSTDSRSFGTTK